MLHTQHTHTHTHTPLAADGQRNHQETARRSVALELRLILLQCKHTIHLAVTPTREASTPTCYDWLPFTLVQTRSLRCTTWSSSTWSARTWSLSSAWGACMNTIACRFGDVVPGFSSAPSIKPLVTSANIHRFHSLRFLFCALQLHWYWAFSDRKRLPAPYFAGMCTRIWIWIHPLLSQTLQNTENAGRIRATADLAHKPHTHTHYNDRWWRWWGLIDDNML